MIPPPAAGAAPAARRRFFFFSASLVSSRVVCCPCVTVVVPLSSCTAKSPLLAAICTRPSTSVTRNSVWELDTGLHRRPFKLHERTRQDHYVRPIGLNAG